jgi:GH15 family glucan-1,4-alpha-glucosidase
MSKLNPQKASAYVGPGVLRKGGKITPVPNGPLIKKKGPFKGSTLKSGGAIKKAQNSNVIAKEFEDNEKKRDSILSKNRKKNLEILDKLSTDFLKKKEDRMRSSTLLKKKAGGMIKRADGSYSKRGLWDNIRANKGSGKKPTKQMLVQEKKIKAKSKK